MASQALPNDLACCRVSAWLPLFRQVTFKTVLLPLPQEFVDFLVADGVHLAEDSEALARRAEDPYASDEDGWESGSGSSEAQVPQFPELMAQMRSAIAELGGAVVPKFTWSCPKDAVWMTLGQTLACHNPDEVVLLLKSSDRVAHDICHAMDGIASSGRMDAGSASDAETAAAEHSASKDRDSSGTGVGDAAVEDAAADAAAPGAVQPVQPVQHVLALRRWHDLRPEREFRCFVRGHELVGVCQRDVTEFYPSLLPERTQLQQRIAEFHEQHIKGRFPLPHYTYDVYVAATAEAVRLVDFNPIGGTTAPLLFEWEELPFGDLLGKGPAGLSGGNDSNGSGNSSSNDRCSGSGVEGTSLTGAAGEAAVGAGRDGSAYGAGAETTAAAAAVAAGAGEAVGEEAVAAVEVEVGRLSLGGDQLGESAGPSCSHANASCPGCSAPAANGSGGGGGSGSSSAPRSFEFRVIEKPVCMRPHKLHYGVPFDFVDSSEGSALDQLRRQMEGAAAGELFAALQKQAS